MRTLQYLFVILITAVLIFAIALFFSTSDRKVFTSTYSQETASTSTNKTQPLRLDRKFSEPNYGYTLQFHMDWTYEKPNVQTVLFRDTAKSSSTVTVENVVTTKGGGNTETLTELLAARKHELSVANATISNEGVLALTQPDGSVLQSRQFIANYSADGTRIKQWQVVIERPDGKAFHVFTYTSEEQTYDLNESIAAAMLKSFQIK